MSRKLKTKGLSSRTANEKWRHVSLYLPPKLFSTIEQRAKSSRRSLSAEIVVTLETVIDPFAGSGSLAEGIKHISPVPKKEP